MQENSSQANLAKAASADMSGRSIADFFSDPANVNAVATNARDSGREGLRLAMKAASQPTVLVEGAMQIAFPMRWYYCHAVPLVNQLTGEIEDRVRIVLISPEGETCSCCSTGVLDSLDMIRRYAGEGPYDPPLPVRFVESRTRQGRKILRLEVDFDAPTESPKQARPRHDK